MSSANIKNATWGVTFLGRDEKTWGKDGIGNIPIDPDVCAPASTTSSATMSNCPYYRDQEHDLDNDKIHLVIASFRDQLCPRTMFNIFSRAKNPHRIHVRVLQQLKPDSDLIDDADCWDMACQTYNNADDHKLLDGTAFNCHDFETNVEMVTIDSGLAKGPCDARSKLSALIEHDYRHSQDGKHRLEPVNVRDYCMQTDSHMDFSDEFDNGLIAMFHRAENDRAVLSTYVASMTQNNKDPKEVPNLCMITFTSTWRNWGTVRGVFFLSFRIDNFFIFEMSLTQSIVFFLPFAKHSFPFAENDSKSQKTQINQSCMGCRYVFPKMSRGIERPV